MFTSRNVCKSLEQRSALIDFTRHPASAGPCGSDV